MSFSLDEQNLAVQEAARTFALKEVRPQVSSWQRDGRFPRTRLSALAKYFLAEATFEAANAAMEIFGGHGLTHDFPITHYVHLAHLARTGEGSANILRLALANDALEYRSMVRNSVRHRAGPESTTSLREVADGS